MKVPSLHWPVAPAGAGPPAAPIVELGPIGFVEVAIGFAGFIVVGAMAGAAATAFEPPERHDFE